MAEDQCAGFRADMIDRRPVILYACDVEDSLGAELFLRNFTAELVPRAEVTYTSENFDASWAAQIDRSTREQVYSAAWPVDSRLSCARWPALVSPIKEINIASPREQSLMLFAESMCVYVCCTQLRGPNGWVNVSSRKLAILRLRERRLCYFLSLYTLQTRGRCSCGV